MCTKVWKWIEEEDLYYSQELPRSNWAIFENFKETERRTPAQPKELDYSVD